MSEMNSNPDIERAAWEIPKEELKRIIESQRNNPEAVDAAITEFTQRTGYQDNLYAAHQIGRFMRGSEVTADNLQRAYEERLAWEMPKEQLKEYLEAQGFTRDDLQGM